MQASTRSVRYWLRRYLPNEIAGTLGAVGGAWLAYRMSGSLVVAAGAGTVAEAVAFYGVAYARALRVELRAHRSVARRHAVLRTAALTVVEFGPAEVVDSLLVRPGLLWIGPMLTGTTPVVGWLLGKLAADAVFYLIAARSHLLTRSGATSTSDGRPRAVARAGAVAD
ncbi:hypothetical protein [Actinotalea sp. K2]|uniref:hypothetical protein n=1 Tax=Actinotalea sp. K2 TaxID=2939438 RepID=UPI002017D699|nr:hypothetical protein [Actinotalea sp. K2]MCL3861117.1 hypothetical protein [Actinotalea sp. K2]